MYSYGDGSIEFNIVRSRSICHIANCQVLYLSFGAGQEVVIKYACSSDNNIQNSLIMSRLNDLMNCYKRFNVDIIKLNS